MVQGEEARVHPPPFLTFPRLPSSPPPPHQVCLPWGPSVLNYTEGLWTGGRGAGDSSLWEVEPFLERGLSQTGPRGSGPSSALRPQLLAQVDTRGALITYLLDA